MLKNFGFIYMSLFMTKVKEESSISIKYGKTYFLRKFWTINLLKTS